MSRVGKLPVEVAQGVKIDLKGQDITVTGPKGTLKRTFPQEVKVEFKENKLWFTPVSKSQRARAMWGLARNLANCMVTGTKEGFSKDMEINGVGYRAAVAGKELKLTLGFSHEVNYKIPDGITIKVDKQTLLNISGADKQLVGQVAAEIRGYRKPEPYKGKGIKYKTETIRRKEGKKK